MLKDLLKKKRRQGAEPNSMMNWSPGMPGYEYQANGVNWHQGGGFPQTQPFYQCRSAPQCARHTHPAPWG